MSIPSRLSILKSKTGLHSFTNITLVRPMAKILLDGAQMILLMRHGGTSLLKVRTRISLVVFKFQTPWFYISYASRFFFGHCKLSFGTKLSNRWFLVGFIDVQHITGQRICSDASVCWWLYCGQNMLYEEWLYPPGHSQLYTRVRLRTIMYSNKRSNLKERGFFVGIYCTGSYFFFLSLT